MTGTVGSPAFGQDTTGQVRTALQRAARRVKPAMLSAWRAAVLRRAKDETAMAAVRSCVVLAPHPDDETLGCGGLIARKRAAGARVRVIVVTDGRFSHRSSVIGPDRLSAIRRDESLRACAELGVPAEDVVHMGLVEGTIAERLDHVVAALTAELGASDPDDVFVTSSLDWHPDHRSLASAAERAVRRRPGPRLLEYPVWGWADGPWSNTPGRSAPRAAYDLLVEPITTLLGARPVTVRTDSGPLERKRSALAAYLSQTTNLTGEDHWAVMTAEFLDQFLQPREVYFERGPSRGRR
jgi:LmbE family N-acetylglucosaminyl deacetylase